MGIKLAFKLQKIEQIEDKKLTLHYNRQQAVQRKHAPQGAIAMMAKDLSGPPHFITVDLDSPFFRKIEIKVDNPVDYAQLGLMATDVEIEYGSRNDPATLKRRDMSFLRSGPTSDSHTFFMNDAHDLDYRITLQYHFDPMSGWDGRALSYTMPPETTLDRTLLINPFNHFGFVDIKVLPGELDRGMIRHTEVQLRYDGGDWQRDRTIVVRPDSPEQSWKLRLDDPERRDFSYTLRHHLVDGSVREVESTATRVPSVTVNDPFDDALIVEFFPNFDGAALQKMFVKVIYEDRINDYRREEDLTFEGALLQPQRLRIARFDRTRQAYSFQITTLGTDHSVKRFAPVTSEETIIFLGEHLSN
ncbi:hypothetical protein FGD77_12735 [Roseovarius sp. M141]|nr:hypothetical protein [Roseovarius sp. M141]